MTSNSDHQTCVKVLSNRALRFTILLLLWGFHSVSLYADNTFQANRATTSIEEAKRLLMQGLIDQAVASLRTILASDPKNARANLLLCRSFYAEEHEDDAITACDDAIQTNPHNSETQDWMGRAYGMKASHVGPISGFSLARRVKAAFESAVELDPTNGAAVNDLSEFYIDAPAIVGGGLDKAAGLADRVHDRLPQQAHRIRALAAERNRDYGAAEREFIAAADVATRPDALADLGAFYRSRGENDKAVEELKVCIAVDRANDASLVDAASLLNDMHREPQLAAMALHRYLDSSGKSDAAPVIRVYVMLGKMLASSGDKLGAKISFGKALSLASSYSPAKQGLQNL